MQPYGFINNDDRTIKRLFKRIMRRSLRWLLIPIYDEINQTSSKSEHIVGLTALQKEQIDKISEVLNAQASCLDIIKKEINALQEVWDAQRIRSDAMQEDLDAKGNRINSLQEVWDAQRIRSDAMQEAIDRINELLAEQEKINSQNRRMISTLSGEVDCLSATAAKDVFAINGDANTYAQKLPYVAKDNSEFLIEGREDAYTALDYFKFQSAFRGTRLVVMEQQRRYLPYFKDCSATVLDIGCGRGEFLYLLKEIGVPAFGIDLYKEYVAEGAVNGIDIRQGDGIVFLQETNQKFGGIFSGQVIEHISFEQLQAFCKAAFEKLVPGGILIMETPNPKCLTVFTDTFYIDPTHNKPVHPAMLEYLVKEIGFKEVEIIYTGENHVGKKLPNIISDSIQNIEEINDAINTLSNLIFGSLDYAVVARKPY